MFEELSVEERQPRKELFEFLVTSVERGDKATAGLVKAVDGYVRDDLEGTGPYGRGGGSIETPIGYHMCQAQFEGIYAVYVAGKKSAIS